MLLTRLFWPCFLVLSSAKSLSPKLTYYRNYFNHYRQVCSRLHFQSSHIPPPGSATATMINLNPFEVESPHFTVLHQPDRHQPTPDWPVKGQTTSNRPLPSCHSTTNTFAAQEQSRFLFGLPREIRNLILLAALLPRDDKEWLKIKRLKAPGVLFACRQLLNEGLPIFLGRNSFLVVIGVPNGKKVRPSIKKRTIKWIKLASALRDPTRTLPPMIIRRLAFVIKGRELERSQKTDLLAKKIRAKITGGPTPREEVFYFQFLLMEGTEWRAQHKSDYAREVMGNTVRNWEKYRPGSTPETRHALGIEDVCDLALVLTDMFWCRDTRAKLWINTLPQMNVDPFDFELTMWKPMQPVQWWYRSNPWPRYLCPSEDSQSAKAEGKVADKIRSLLVRHRS